MNAADSLKLPSDTELGAAGSALENESGHSPSKARRNRRSGGTQERGRQRREHFLQCAREILRTQSLREITYTEICRHAGVPNASAYHFFPNKFAIIEAMVKQLGPEFHAAVNVPIPTDAAGSWRDVIHILSDRTVAFLNADQSAREVLIGGHVPPEIRKQTRKRRKRLATAYRNHLALLFVLPLIPDEESIFSIAVEIIEAIYALSHLEHGYITPFMADAAFQAGASYLSLYLPPTLSRRT